MNIAGFYDESISNGIGWRCVLFVSGCPHHCPGCQNEEAQDFNYGEKFIFDEYLKKIKDNSILKGLTFSGGEPLCQENVKGCLDFLNEVKKIRPDFNYWCYTGYTFEELINRNDEVTNNFLNEIDVLVDGRFIKELKDPDLTFKGSKNQRIIDVKKTLKEHKIIEIIL